MIHPCWICGQPNERSEGCELASEAEACGACERSFLAWVDHVEKAGYDYTSDGKAGTET